MTYDELVAENERLRAENAELKRRVAEFEALLKQLQEQLEAARRAGKRQATPFSKGRPKDTPKTAGRKPGHPAAHRPPPDHVDRVEEAPLPSTCPECGGAVLEDEVRVQYQVDIPRPVPTVVTQFNVHVGHCESCQHRFQGRHPDQTSDALGAAAVQIGRLALGLAAEMKHGLGVSYGKVVRLLETSFGLSLERSTVARADARLADHLEPTYHRLILRLRRSAVVHGDETGWKVAGHNAWLWVFTNDSLTVYVIDPRRAHGVVERILGEDFAGVLGCDCFLAYDALDGYRQSKCAGHLLRRCAEISESKSGRAVRFSQQVARRLRAAITLKQRRTQMSEPGYAVACGRLEAALDRLLAGHYTDPDNARLAKLLRKQRDHLLTFLYVEAMDPTNNAAERELRPGVIIRKTNGCNRSPAGANTHSILASVIRTCQKHGRDFVETVKRVLRHPRPIALDIASRCTDIPVLPPTPAVAQAQGP
ncbi:MAG: IS66 family transposase [Burkholderiales bacterium]